MRQFETIRYQANKYCPCGRSNKGGKFATEKGFRNQPIGHCFSCNKDFWDNNTLDTQTIVYHKQPAINYCHPPIEDISETFDHKLQSGFAKFLVENFGKTKAEEVVEMYFLGNYNGDVIFWQLGRNNDVRAGKIIPYLPNGKRNRNDLPNWWHKVKGKDCQLRQCLFGDHLIPDHDKPIAVVESAKSACIMHLCNPYYIWLSAEGLHGLSYDKCNSIKDYEVVLFPDAGYYQEWEKKANEFGFDISLDCEIWKEKGIINDKEDIADYYLNKYSPEVLSN